MQNWKFKISGQLLVPGMENTVLNIYPENFKTFNKRVGILPLKYIEYEIVNNDIIFKDLEY